MEAGLERALAAQLPDGASETLVPTIAYQPLFSPDPNPVQDVTGAGITFDSQGRVISYISGTNANGTRSGFVRSNADGTNLEFPPLVAGEDFVSLGLAANSPFTVTNREPLGMAVTNVGGVETLLFILYDSPEIFMVPVDGGRVTAFHRFSEGFAWNLKVVDRQGARDSSSPTRMETSTGSICPSAR